MENENAFCEPQCEETPYNGECDNPFEGTDAPMDAPTGPNPDPAYDGWGGCFPGDGSGMDDLADYNANEADDYMGE